MKEKASERKCIAHHRISTELESERRSVWRQRIWRTDPVSHGMGEISVGERTERGRPKSKG